MKNGKAHELKAKFWNALDESPFVFLQLDREPHTAVPMTAQLDPEAEGVIWFFAHRGHPLAADGPATATFASKDHNIFARLRGVLSRETRRARLDRQWGQVAEAWFDGKDDPKLVMLRLDLTGAEIWNSDLGFLDNTRMLLGFDVTEEARENHLATAM